MDHDSREIGERHEKGCRIFVSFAYFAAIVVQPAGIGAGAGRLDEPGAPGGTGGLQGAYGETGAGRRAGAIGEQPLMPQYK